MDTIDRSDSNLPARFSVNSLPLQAAMLPQDLATTSGPQITPQLLMRGLTRHWWRILLLWLAVSTPLVYLIFLFVHPIYQAASMIRVEPSAPNLFATSKLHDVVGGGASPYLQTQVQLIKSDLVLDPALSSPTVSIIPAIKNSEDPKADLRKKLTVEAVEDAFLIRVSLESTEPQDAAAIVNAVVESYRIYNERYALSANKRLRDSLEREDLLLQNKIEAVQVRLKALVQEGRVAPAVKEVPNTDDDPTQQIFKNLGAAHYQSALADLLRVDGELIDAESTLAVMEGALKSSQEEDGQEGLPTDEELNPGIEEEFKKDPEVAGLMAEITDIQNQLERTKETARQPHDPAAITLHKRRAKLMDQYENLWKNKYDGILQRLKGGGVLPTGTGPSRLAISDLRIKVASLKKKKESLTKRFDQMKVDNKEANTDTLQSQILSHDLLSYQSRKDNVTANLAQLQFESNQEAFRIVLVDPAGVPITPSNNKRLKLMAAAPVGVLVMMFGLFFLLEIKAERVADPDTLSTRVQSKVYSLPPLPTARSMRRLNVPGADDQIEHFIQRLDHLRFAVCGTSVELGKGRCVLITSAIGGEGKTTLAAQLAARCGNAGMSTILIDADLRRAALCLLLDVPEGPGLSDVLKDEATVEDVVIPVQGGTFVLFPAGTPVQDTSRILQSSKLGELIAQLRQAYDLIIIDSPPILPVPDGLILGQWTDGAVLASRFDISRFSQVERARRELDSAGITVLGTVINGMRTSDSYSYAYTRRRSSTSDTIET
jgi:succinoglycan biosynthesis transport protein ExoP